MLVGLDDFRRFNELGYRSHGDRALLDAATTIRRTIRRAGDRIYRMHAAGDEFLILLTARSYAQAFSETEKRRAGRSSWPRFQRRSGSRTRPGSSSRTRPASMLEVATTNKNRAGRDGKNRVYPPNDPPPPPIAIGAEHAGPHLLPTLARGLDVEPTRIRPTSALCSLR